MTRRQSAERLLSDAADALARACDPKVSPELTQIAATLSVATSALAIGQLLLDQADRDTAHTRIVPFARPRIVDPSGDSA